MTSALSLPSKKSLVFLELSYGHTFDPTFERFTNWSQDAEHNGFVYSAMPDLEVKPIRKTGTLEEPPAKFSLKLKLDEDGEIDDPDSFVALSSNGEPFPPTFVRIDEVSFEQGKRDVVALHRGRMSIVRRNFHDRPDLVEYESESWKSMLKTPLGIPATHLCPWRFAGKGCFLPGGIEPLKETGVIEDIDGATVTISGLASHSERRYWHRGYIDVDGLVIDIRDWDGDDDRTVFKLVKFPPVRWLDAEVVVAPGCHKTHSRCNQWGNLEHFGGIGFKMPNRNPILESGDNT